MDDMDAIFANHDQEPTSRTSVQGLRDELFTQLGPRKLKIKDPKSSRNPTDSLVSPARGVNGTGGGSRASSSASSTPRPRPTAPPDDDEEVLSDDDSPYPDNNGIIVVAATSAPWLLYKDHELLSRFRGVYLVGLPDKQTRYNLLRSLFQDVHHNLSDKEIMVVAEKTEGFTPADLMVVVKTLTYRQFSFLLSMTAARTGSAGSSSDVGSTGSQTPLSSEMSEVRPKHSTFTTLVLGFFMAKARVC
ncbi:Vacuolar protein sorting-associated protein 4A [Chionoecetes opilio]|uniref:Vacuolar protein sorting-associated protein 4A n=1 Tax=Chionoecetes opilio TaxID=41210 RepID=A0A8J4XKI7_CHIOP|nr:Vacuolar protein sorting-associated protein 4A [Chionoecetes opilio]